MDILHISDNSEWGLYSDKPFVPVEFLEPCSYEPLDKISLDTKEPQYIEMFTEWLKSNPIPGAVLQLPDEYLISIDLDKFSSF